MSIRIRIDGMKLPEKDTDLSVMIDHAGRVLVGAKIVGRAEYLPSNADSVRAMSDEDWHGFMQQNTPDATDAIQQLRKIAESAPWNGYSVMQRAKHERSHQVLGLSWRLVDLGLFVVIAAGVIVLCAIFVGIASVVSAISKKAKKKQKEYWERKK